MSDIVQEICDWAANSELQIDYLQEILDRYSSSQQATIKRLKTVRNIWVIRWLELFVEMLEHPDNEWMIADLQPLLAQFVSHIAKRQAGEATEE